jgi:pilus assembly protein CpaE
LATILVIDDDVQLTRLLEITLKNAGHGVLTARDGEVGLAMTEKERPDLVIADVMMPKINGYEYCRRVRAQADLAGIPILVFSARFQPIDQETALAAGATDYIPKTVGARELIAHIERILQSSPQAPEVKLGRVVAVFSLRGGAGVTSLAVNLSVAFALSRQQPVGMVDMVPLAGHAALMLDLRPGKGLRTALAATGQVDHEALGPYWQTHQSGVHLLPSPLSRADAGEVSPGAVEPLAAHLRQAFPAAWLDLPSTLSDTTAAALIASDRVLLVVTPDMASLQSAAVALQAMGGIGIQEDRIWVVLNAPGGVGGLSPETVSKALRVTLAANIPYEPGMLAALNSRRPLMLASPKSAAAQAITGLAGKLMAS